MRTLAALLGTLWGIVALAVVLIVLAVLFGWRGLDY